MLTDETILRSLESYGIRPTALQCDQVRVYIALLLKWNRSISLTSVTDERELLKFHVGESAFALHAISGIVGRLADVGAGAGFPGIPLRIFCGGIQLVLIESNTKKCAFLSEVVRALEFEDVEVIHSRFEDASEILRAGPDIVASRALGEYENLAAWSSDTLRPGGKIVLWLGADGSREVARIPGWRWLPPVPIPNSTRRYILVGQRT